MGRPSSLVGAICVAIMVAHQISTTSAFLSGGKALLPASTKAASRRATVGQVVMDLSTAPVSTVLQVYTKNAAKKEVRKDR